MNKIVNFKMGSKLKNITQTLLYKYKTITFTK